MLGRLKHRCGGLGLPLLFEGLTQSRMDRESRDIPAPLDGRGWALALSSFSPGSEKGQRGGRGQTRANRAAGPAQDFAPFWGHLYEMGKVRGTGAGVESWANRAAEPHRASPTNSPQQFFFNSLHNPMAEPQIGTNAHFELY